MPLNTKFASNTSAPDDRTATGVSALKYALPPRPDIFRIIIADRLPVLARGLCAILSDFANFEASSHPFLNEVNLTEICRIQPDILILDPSQTTLLPSALVQILSQSKSRPALIGFCSGVSPCLACPT